MNRRSASTTKIFVGSLPPDTTPQDLRELFSSYGEIVECDVVNRCGFLHLENRQLAFKAIDELHNTDFKGSRISVEKGRVKPPSNRDGRGSRGGGGGRNGFGPMRSNRDNFRGGPYGRDGGDFERRGPPRGNFGRGRGGGGGGYDRGFDRNRPMNDSNRRPFSNDRRGGFDDNFMGPGGDSNRNMYQNDRQGRGAPFDRRPPMIDRKPFNTEGGMMLVINAQGPGGLGSAPAGPMQPPVPSLNQGFGNRNDMFSRRDMPPKPMGGGAYNSPGNSNYNNYGAQQNSNYSGPGPRRDLPPVRRF